MNARICRTVREGGFAAWPDFLTVSAQENWRQDLSGAFPKVVGNGHGIDAEQLGHVDLANAGWAASMSSRS